MNAGHSLHACIEAGGTKFVVGLVTSTKEIVESARFPTTTPDETLGHVLGWLNDAVRRYGSVASAGIASFGPIELDRESPNWGHVTKTPKPGWSNINVAGAVSRALGVATGFDTDVNGAGLAEARWGAAQGQRLAVYVTVGTGVGGGIVIDGKPVNGLSHPEMGHMRVPRHPDDQDFAGICPFHSDCLEGLICGPAIIARWGSSLSTLPSDHPAHDIVAWYLAQMVVTLQALLEPGRIIFGGGVMGSPDRIARVRKAAAALGHGYFRGDPREIIVAPGLGDKAGLFGALALAMDVIRSGA